MNDAQVFASEWDVSLIYDCCNKRDRDIFIQRLKGKTQKEIGQQFKMSRGRVSEIVKRCMRRARNQSFDNASSINNLLPEKTIINFRGVKELGVSGKLFAKTIANHAYFLADSFNKAPN